MCDKYAKKFKKKEKKKGKEKENIINVLRSESIYM